jgi:hypothetical protein
VNVADAAGAEEANFEHFNSFPWAARRPLALSDVGDVARR